MAALTARVLEMPASITDRLLARLGASTVSAGEAAVAASQVLDELVARGGLDAWAHRLAGPAGPGRIDAADVLAHAGAAELVARKALEAGGSPSWLLEPAANPLLPRVLETLVKALGDPSAAVRERALLCVGYLGPRADTAAQAVAECLRDTVVEVCKRALATLGDLGSGGALGVPAMVQALREGRVEFWDFARAARGLGRGASAALPVLMEKLSSEDGSDREMAVEALGALGPEAARAASAIATLLLDPSHGRPLVADRFLRKKSLFEMALEWAAGEKEEEPQPGPETKAVLDEGRARSLRQAAARALGAIGPAVGDGAVLALAQALSDRDKYVKRNAAASLAGMGAPAASACPALLDSLKDPEVREEALKALAVVGSQTRRGRDALVWGLSVPGLDYDTAAALAGAGQETMLLRWAQEQLRPGTAGASGPERAVHILPNLGFAAQPLVPAIVAMLGESDERLQREAASALGELGPAAASAEPALVSALDTPSPYLRAEVAEALGRIGADPERAVPALAGLVGDSESEVRRAAAEALGLFGPDAEDAVDAIALLLADRAPRVRLAAILALGRIGAEAARAVPALAEALRDETGAWEQGTPGSVELAEKALVAIGPAACGALLTALASPGDAGRVRLARVLRRIASGQ
ncbi:MAG: HEAT repeat domain-containing protein [Candidatus Wallbacteria bacterium]|nr:HEAT repeat domain-containing protein [Candidatus Wallbacteria bacterium]